MTGLSLTMKEWQVLSPASTSLLQGVSFGADERARHLAEQLTRFGQLQITELASGLAINSTSFVGRVQLGPLQVTIEPKLKGAPLLQLLRYAYTLRPLNLLPLTVYGMATHSFHDLLIHQLATEVAELLARGLQRGYQRTAETLTNPRGQIDFAAYPRVMATGQAQLPCIHFPRSQDSALNRLLYAGLTFAGALTQDHALRGQLRRLGKLLDGAITPTPLSWELLKAAKRQVDRQTIAYQPALTLIELLLHAQGMAFDDAEPGTPLPGLLFDMNRLYQALLSRFLRENLLDYQVVDEYSIREMLAYVPAYNPKKRQAPTPRPDFVLLAGGKVVQILDAKYRDLWEQPLPREMLYQLVIYALSQGQGTQAVILYPTMDTTARDARIAISEPVGGMARAHVILRPVHLLAVAQLLAESESLATQRKRQALARFWVFGEETKDDQ